MHYCTLCITAATTTATAPTNAVKSVVLHRAAGARQEGAQQAYLRQEKRQEKLHQLEHPPTQKELETKGLEAELVKAQELQALRNRSVVLHEREASWNVTAAQRAEIDNMDPWVPHQATTPADWRDRRQRLQFNIAQSGGRWLLHSIYGAQ
jgi:hypothetical protein